MPNKLSLVGGGVDEGEQPIDGAKREIKEETGLEINDMIEKFVIQRGDSVEHLFVTKLPKNYENYHILYIKVNLSGD